MSDYPTFIVTNKHGIRFACGDHVSYYVPSLTPGKGLDVHCRIVSLWEDGTVELESDFFNGETVEHHIDELDITPTEPDDYAGF